MLKVYKIKWIEIIPEIFDQVPDLDKTYKLSNETNAKITQYAPGDPVRFDFNISPNHYEFDIVNNYSEEDRIIYVNDTVRINSTRLLRFIESQLQSESNNIILPLLG